MAGYLSKGFRTAAFLSFTSVVLAGGCDHPRSKPEGVIAASYAVSQLSQALVGKQITVRGKLQLGKPGACVVLDNQQEVYLTEMHPKRVSEDPFDGMYDKLVEATGTLKFYRNTVPVDETRALAIQIEPDHYYFEQETTQLRLIAH